MTERGQKILIRAEWAGRAACCFCGAICFVHSGSDGHFYCETCKLMKLRAGVAEEGGWHKVSIDHEHSCPVLAAHFMRVEVGMIYWYEPRVAGE